MKKNEMLILVGGSGSGKDTVLKELSKNGVFEKLVTTTTREPRDGEIDGINYHFLTKEQFEEKIEKNEFIEYVNYNGNYYGSSLKSFENNKSQKVPVVILEPKGAKAYKELLKNTKWKAKTVFMNESEETCIERVLSRAANEKEKEERVNKIKTEEKGWATAMKYDFKTKPLSSIEDNAKAIEMFFKKNKLTRKNKM